jgi:hypothetical protein
MEDFTEALTMAHLAGMQQERERTIRIAETKAGHPYEYSLCNCEWCELVYLIKDRNVL